MPQGHLGSYLQKIFFFLNRRHAQTRSGDYGLRMVHLFAPNKVLRAPHWEERFHFVRYTPGIEDQWIELLNASCEFGLWSRERLEDEILSSLLSETTSFVKDQGRLIACSAACHIKQYEPYAVLMYPLVLQKYRNRGIGTRLIVETVAACQRLGYPGMILNTEDLRIPAIKTYFKLGFKPDITTNPGSKERWRVISDSLPAIAVEAGILESNK